MKNNVYFIKTSNGDNIEAIRDKFRRLLQESRILDCAKKGDKAVVKLHFGEEGNTGYVKPEYVRLVCDNVNAKGAKCFLADTNTLYGGRRTKSIEHTKLAREHGFTREAVAAEVIIPDDSKKENVSRVRVDGKFIKTAKVAKFFLEADVFLGIAHFKGHIMTGFAGALKNIGMGCASREGKLAQHCDIAPYVAGDKCIACEACIKACPADTIFIKDKVAYIEPEGCIGCASCIAACKQNAIEIHWEAGKDNIQEKMVEYAGAVLNHGPKKRAFINFAIKITKECDCLAKDDPRIVPDVGIFASMDPVSIDQASADLVNEAAGKDIFREVHPLRDAFKQLEHAARMGLGSREYKLVKL